MNVLNFRKQQLENIDLIDCDLEGVPLNDERVMYHLNQEERTNVIELVDFFYQWFEDYEISHKQCLNTIGMDMAKSYDPDEPYKAFISISAGDNRIELEVHEECSF